MFGLSVRMYVRACVSASVRRSVCSPSCLLSESQLITINKSKGKTDISVRRPLVQRSRSSSGEIS